MQDDDVNQQGLKMNIAELLIMKYPHADFNKDILLRECDEGIEIYGWELDDPKPTADMLAAWAVELDLPYRQKLAVQKRVYPSFGAQLDMIYHDSLNNTTLWIDTIAEIKAAHPKPME